MATNASVQIIKQLLANIRSGQNVAVYADQPDAMFQVLQGMLGAIFTAVHVDPQLRSLSIGLPNGTSIVMVYDVSRVHPPTDTSVEMSVQSFDVIARDLTTLIYPLV